VIAMGQGQWNGHILTSMTRGTHLAYHRPMTTKAPGILFVIVIVAIGFARSAPVARRQQEAGGNSSYSQ
jgi:hypothetical protein